MKVKFYKLSDYLQVKALYKEFGWFDSETDSEVRLANKIKRDPSSIFVAEESGEVVGTISIIEDGRVAWLFRLNAKTPSIRKMLIHKAEKLLIKKEYKEVHIFVPLNDPERQKEYTNGGFKLGSEYKWAWKKL